MAEINYQARDFDSLRDSIIAYALQNFPQWTDLNESEQGMILAELFAYIGDGLHFYIDKQTDEWDIDKVTQRYNAIALHKLNGYKLTGATPAQVMALITIDAPAAADVPIPQGLKIYTRDPRSTVVFEVLTAGYKIAAGQTSVAIPIVHGETQEQFYRFDGTTDQAVTVIMTPYLEGYTTIEIGAEIWTEVPDLLDSTATETHFFVEVDEQDRAVLKFGDGISGAKPNGTGMISHRTGGGEAGNVGPNTLTVPESPQLLDANGVPVSIEVTNPAGPFIQGTEKESVQEARKRGRNFNKTNQRTVAAEDFVNHSLEVDGIIRALARFTRDVKAWQANTAVAVGEIRQPTVTNGHYYVCTVAGVTHATNEPAWPTGAGATIASGAATFQEYGASIPQNLCQLQLIPEGGGNPTQAQKDAVKAYLYDTKPVPTTMVVDPIDPKYKAVNVTAEIVLKPGAVWATVEAAAEAAITAYLNGYTAENPEAPGTYVLDWGMTIYPDDLAIKVDGCRSIKITAPAAPVRLTAVEIPQAGIITAVQA